MDYTIKHNGFWFQHFILFVCVLFISGMKRSGVRLYNETGIITSPGYPNDYPNSVAVIWLINTTQSKYIELTFVDFDVEPYSDCAADYVKIRNKKASSWSFKDVPQIDLTTKESTTKISTKGPYCNSNRPPKIITSSSNLMAIVFIADSSESHRGFKATYRSIEKKVCNIIKTESSGTIITPGYPLRYPNEGECYWTISVLPGKFIRLEFIEFDLEFNTQLCMDEIYIWDGASSSAPLLARGCLLNPKVIYSSSNHMRIKFTSQGYHRNKGFKAIYTTSSSKGCGGDFSSANGTFDSPSFDLLASYTYPAYSDCLWTISAPVGNVISLKFPFFDVLTGASGHCDEDYVDVFDGSVQGQMSRIGRYCNSKKPSVVVSSSNLLQIRFISNHKGHGKGFRVKFQRHSTACDQPLGIEDGRISDNRISASSYLKQNSFFKPSFARLNGLYAWCSQVQINNRVGEYLQIDFKEYNKITGFATQGYTIDGQKYFIKKYKIEYSNNGGLFFTAYKDPTDNSRSDYTIFQGNNEIKRNHLKHPVVTKMFRIYPLGYVHGKRRVICMRAELYGCKFNFGDGKLLQNPDDNILHNAASNTKSSHWVISPSNMYGNSVVYIMPLFFNIDCKKSTLRISDGVTNKSYCDKNQPPPFQVFSAKGQIFVSLETKEGQNAVQQRFGLQYFTENLGSGRIMRSRRGIVRSPRHVPERVSNQTASTWIIVQPNKERIVARFTTLRLGKSHHGKCDEYVEIKDGLLDTSPSYGNFCIGIPRKPLVSTGNYLRVILHSKNTAVRFKREMQQSRIVFEIAYRTLENSKSTESQVTSEEDEEPGTISIKTSKGHCESGLHVYLAALTLLVTLWSTIFPR